MKTHWIFVTGGVLSSLGKGIAAASIGALMKARGLTVGMIKMDPYLNVDTSTMSPSQHGEVFVLDDGTETDLDLGHYSRFAQVPLSRQNSITSGSVYWEVLHRERKGEYLGSTIQTIPHITDEIKNRLENMESKYDIVIVELGGTVGDVESMPFLESIRQIISEKKHRCAIVHLVWVPWVSSASETKTKPAQASVRTLMEHGLVPDILVCRSDHKLSKEAISKLALFGGVHESMVIEAPDVDTVYEVPLNLYNNGINEALDKTLNLPNEKPNLESWDSYIKSFKNPSSTIKVAIVGKYSDVKDSYKSLYEALYHASTRKNTHCEITLVSAEDIEELGEQILQGYHGIVVAGGFGPRGFEGKISAVKYARENNIAFLGICLGMQAAVIEFARNVANLKDANSTEMNPNTEFPVICLMEEQQGISNMGGTLRVGSYECVLESNTFIHNAYNQKTIQERHRHRWEFNSNYEELLKQYGLVISGKEPNLNIVESVELRNHRWFVGVQFHPELKSVVPDGHPLFDDFILHSIIMMGEENGKLSNGDKIH
jgi:CTP synthase